MISNISKTANISMYRYEHTPSLADQNRFLEDINDTYNGLALQYVLEDIAALVGATTLHKMHHDFHPHGASAALLVSESHIAAHTYPQAASESCFRIDIDISGCGKTSPLRALSYLLRKFTPSILDISYGFRGFDYIDGGKVLPVVETGRIADSIDPLLLDKYSVTEQQLSDHIIIATIGESHVDC